MAEGSEFSNVWCLWKSALLQATKSIQGDSSLILWHGAVKIARDSLRWVPDFPFFHPRQSRLPLCRCSGGGIRVRESRIYATKEEAEKAVGKNITKKETGRYLDISSEWEILHLIVPKTTRSSKDGLFSCSAHHYRNYNVIVVCRWESDFLNLPVATGDRPLEWLPRIIRSIQWLTILIMSMLFIVWLKNGMYGTVE